ncbi:Structural maintenance of chromosomes protein 4 [Manis javanica]|nr:Structural maintenance of chromosomes protein 4 [Manis javanica]
MGTLFATTGWTFTHLPRSISDSSSWDANIIPSLSREASRRDSTRSSSKGKSLEAPPPPLRAQLCRSAEPPAPSTPLSEGTQGSVRCSPEARWSRENTDRAATQSFL